MQNLRLLGVLFCILANTVSSQKARAISFFDSGQTRSVTQPDDLQFWLENMMVWHGYSNQEAADVLGMEESQVLQQMSRFGIQKDKKTVRAKNDPLTLLPYPGGRHPRIGFLEGAVNPQRETKISVFTPWDDSSYVVVDLPEAIFSNLGLTYLAHTHIPTIFDHQKIPLEKLEWSRPALNHVRLKRILPNGITYIATARTTSKEVQMELELINGTDQPLSGLKVQQCAMLKMTKGFESQINSNKKFDSPYAIVQNAEGTRWIIHAWTRPVRVWGNAPCPCLHSDPQFPDLQPGQKAKLQGRLWFYEGTDIDHFISELKKTGWDRK